jgi:hypothetical protein
VRKPFEALGRIANAVYRDTMPIDQAAVARIRRRDHVEIVPAPIESTRQEVDEHPGHVPFEAGKGVGDHADPHGLG